MNEFTWSDKCDEEIWKNGKTVLMIAGSSKLIQKAVEELSNKSGCKCDWNYMGGRAIIQTMPENYEKVVNTILDESWDKHLAEEIRKQDEELYGISN